MDKDINTQPQADFLKGTVERITYRNEENGFSVLKVSKNGDNVLFDKNYTLVGSIPSTVSEGSSFVARGVWQSHPKFGAQFKAYSFSEAAPTGTDAIKRYLSSGLIKGVGEKIAEKIVAHFGEETMNILEDDPDRLEEVSGLGRTKIQEIKTTWIEKKEEREVLLFFQNYAISTALARRIYNVYRSKSIEVVRANPYVLCQQVWGIGFATADKIAVAIGLDPKSKDRLIAGLSYTLSSAEQDGHTYLPEEVLIEKSKALLAITEGDLLKNALSSAELQGLVIKLEDKYYDPEVFYFERKAAELIANRIKTTEVKKIPDWIIEEVINAKTVTSITGKKDIDSDNESTTTETKVISLSNEQKEAVRLAASSSLLVITGGPGCGKTTVVSSIGALFKKAGLTIRLAAPTGRAAQRLQELCGIEASTIHRLLKFDPIRKTFIYDEGDQLPFDVLILDESSMLDIPLAASLLKAVGRNTKLIFVGDKDQLPSVGPGLFFSDLLKLDQVPKVFLTKLFRRAEESSINDIAYQINMGVVPNIPEPDGSGIKDAYFMKVDSPEQAANLIERLVAEQVPKKFHVKPSEITVLSPMNQGELGIISLNQKLQNKLVPTKETTPVVKVGNAEFRVGDRVCQRVNNYNIHEAGVFNGEQGIVFGIDTEEKAVFVRLWDNREIKYSIENIPQLDLAYALTIHRSQGSEVPVVILVLHDSHAIMLERQLVYTAVTRAKKLLIVVGTRSAIARSAKRIKSSKRYTGFKDMVLKVLNSYL